MSFRLKDLSPAQVRMRRLARKLARERSNLQASLVRLRLAKGFTQKDVADKLGVSQPAIARFERYDNDPKLSTVHRYALAIGALIEHQVCDADADSITWVDVPVNLTVGEVRIVGQSTADGFEDAEYVEHATRSSFAIAA